MRFYLVLLLFFPLFEGRIFTVVPANDEVCFEEVVVEGASGLRGSYEVLEGGHLDIDITISLDSKEIQVLNLATKGDLVVNRGSGKYKVCFGNKMSTVTEKMVGFSLHGDIGELIEDEDVAKVEHVRPIQQIVDTLADKIQKLQEHERYLSTRLVRHIETAQSTHFRVVVSTMIEAIVLAFVNLAQIWYLKRYFETRRKL